MAISCGNIWNRLVVLVAYDSLYVTTFSAYLPTVKDGKNDKLMGR
jgi:hypothetical protein